jgi:O-antigen/teichoic acid export membrane protein
MQDLRNKTIRAGFANLSGRSVVVLLRIVSIVTLGRLLSPRDYGVVAMVTSFTGVLGLLSGFGLLQAAIQRDTLTEERASTLFWVNVILGFILSAVALALAPVASAFYREPELVLATSISAIMFLFTGAGIQHGALLARQMRFDALAWIDGIACFGATSLAIGLALAGCGYWALVSLIITAPLITTIGVWLATGWIPKAPRLHDGIWSLLHFGGTVTLQGLVTYVAWNFDKLLLGRFWGAHAIGLYGRAQTLIMVPVDSLNATVGDVAFAALSRARGDQQRLRRYFLKGYALVVALTVPLSIACALFSDDLIAVALGAKWADSAEIFRLLAPTILVFSIANPLGWLLNALGLVKRSLKIALASVPLVMVGAALGLPYGPSGVAIAYSAVMLLKVVPLTAWALHGTPIRLSDIFGVLRPPLASSLVAAGCAYAVHLLLGPTLAPLPRLVVDVALFSAVYAGLLSLSTQQRTLYLDLLRWSKVVPV